MPDEKMSKEDWISAKIKKLIGEGKDPKQAAAIAHSMWERRGKRKALGDDESHDLTLDEKYFERLAQREVGYVTLSTKASAACANCRWFKPATGWDDGRVDSCHLIDNYPDEIMPTGWCERHEVKQPAPPPQMTPLPVVIVEPDTMEAKEKALIERIWDSIQARLGSKAANEPTLGFKVQDNSWIAIWSNNFVDRDGEIFTAKAQDDYIARVDTGLVPLPELWVWHTPGSRIGQADWVDRHGHFMLAGGHFDDTPEAAHAKTYYKQRAHLLGVSHGFAYLPHDYDGKHYHAFNTVEISPLLGGREANLLTALPIEGIKDMKDIKPEKKQHLIDVLGQERAERLLKNLEEGGKAYEELGVEFKDFAEAADAPTANADKAALGSAEKAFGDLLIDVAEGQGEAVKAALEAVKSAKATTAQVTTLQREVETLRAEVKAIREGAPRASQSNATVIDTSKLPDALKDALKEQTTERDKFWGTEVSSTNGNGS